MAAQPPQCKSYFASIQPDTDSHHPPVDPTKATSVPRHYVRHATAEFLHDHSLWSVCKESRIEMKRVYAHWEADMSRTLEVVSTTTANDTDDTEDTHTATAAPASSLSGE